MQVRGAKIPSRGDHVVQHRTGVVRVGYVWYADQLQVLVKWEDGTSSSLRIGRDRFSIRPVQQEDSRKPEAEPAASPALESATA